MGFEIQTLQLSFHSSKPLCSTIHRPLTTGSPRSARPLKDILIHREGKTLTEGEGSVQLTSSLRWFVL